MRVVPAAAAGGGAGGAGATVAAAAVACSGIVLGCHCILQWWQFPVLVIAGCFLCGIEAGGRCTWCVVRNGASTCNQYE
jgi:hypothetical protein